MLKNFKAYREDYLVIKTSQINNVSNFNTCYMEQEYAKRTHSYWDHNTFIDWQNLDYLLVCDFECQCLPNQGKEKLKLMEIIEFPVVLIDTRSMKQVACFHTFIKPEIYPTLTDFCKELTGISQEEVDGGVVLQVAIRQLHSFLLENEVFGSNYAFVSCGSFDANAIK